MDEDPIIAELFSDLIVVLFFIIMMRNNMGTVYCLVLLTAAVINWYGRIRL